MEDFIELGIEGFDSLVDNHFHKVPDKFLHRHTYHPRNIRSRNRRRSSSPTHPSDESRSDGESSENEPTRKQNHRRDLSPPNASEVASYDPSTIPVYSNRPPYSRPQYIPAEHGASQIVSSITRRPKAVSRRSSSHPGFYYDRQLDGPIYSSSSGRHLQKRQRSNPDIKRPSTSHKAKDTPTRGGAKEELKDRFTTSTEGVIGAGIGAAVGGWATSRAQTWNARNKKKSSSSVLTVLGAAIGGLAVNAAVDRWEDKKKEEKGRQGRYRE